MSNIYIQIVQAGQGLSNPVIATVTGSRGSTPQKPGSSALFGRDGLLSGTVGGGIVENRVGIRAEQCSLSGESLYLNFSLDNDISRKDDAICGGTISVLLDADPLSHLSVFKAMELSLSESCPGVLLTVVTTSNESCVSIRRYWVTAESLQKLPGNIKEKTGSDILSIISSANRADFRQLEIVIPGEDQPSLVFLEPVFPLPRLVIAGAGHVGRTLAHLGKMLGFEVTVADSRAEYANSLNLPDADQIIAGDIGKTLEDIKKDRDTYMVILTHGHADDAVALKACIRSDAAYVGMIGSKGKIAKMREEFIARKWATDEEWQKIFSPVGIEIGSKTVEEIAVSIAAQLVLVRSRKSKA